MKLFLGIDPGKEGAIVRMETIGDRVDTLSFYDTPTVKAGAGGKRDFDEAAMAELLLDLISSARADGCECFVTIEKQFAMPFTKAAPCKTCKRKPQPGITSTFETGKGFGVWLGIIAATMVPFAVVHPATWKALMLKDAPPGKESSLMVAKREFPTAAVDLKLKKHHNRAEALLICEYGRRRCSNK